MNLHQLDLNLLVIFDALMRTRSVTLAGEKVGLSQSATSNCLQRLRDAFNDPLFVRTPAGMQPTPLASSMEEDVRVALERLQGAMDRQQKFDPATARRAFHVLLSDIAQQTQLPTLMSVLRAEAPQVSLVNVSLSLREAKEALAHGELDLAVGFLPDLGPDCHRQPLDQEHWECLVSTDHPTIRDTLTPELYLGACHIRYEPRGAAHASLDKLLDAQLEGRSLQRRAALSVPYLSGMDRVVAGTDLVLTLPSRLAKSLSAAGRLRALPMPFDLPPIALNMQWHERVHRDLGHGWLRRTIAACYRGHRA